MGMRMLLRMRVRRFVAMGMVMPMLASRAQCAGLGGVVVGSGMSHAMIGNLQVTSMSNMLTQSPRHRIGDAARLSGVPAANIRYYEKEGLLCSQTRADNRYRLYSDEEVHRLRFVRLCRAMDMSLPEVRSLLQIDASAGAGAHADHAACATLDEHLQHVRTRLAELQVLEAELQALRSRCDGSGAQCQVIQALHARADTDPVPLPLPAGKRHV